MSELVSFREFRKRSQTTPIWPRIRNIRLPRQNRKSAHIAELEDKLARAEVIDVSKLSGDTVKFGATVTLIEENTGEKKVWQIVGEPEADVKKGKISVTSPIARALIGKKRGEAPGGDHTYKIQQVQWLVDGPKKRGP